MSKEGNVIAITSLGDLIKINSKNLAAIASSKHKVGLDIDMTGHDSWPFLFSENAGYVCAVKPKEKDKFIECCSSQGVYTAHIGRTISDLNVVLRQSDNVCLDLSIETLNENWNKSSH